MSKGKLAGIIAGCVVVIIVVVLALNDGDSNGGGSNGGGTYYTLVTNTSPPEGGSVSPAGGEYESGEKVPLTARPASGYTFDCWSGDAGGTTSTITVNMDSDKSVTANFKTAPSVTIALDYFGIRDTGWIEQFQGDDKAKIQLVVLIRDERGTLATFAIPAEGVAGFSMDFFQVNALRDNMDPNIFTGTLTGSLTFSIAAYNVNKGPITKAQIDAISKWTGVDWSAIKALVPDKELVGSCWRTWSASENFGVGENYESDDGNLKVWLRVGADETMPDPVARPVLEPNVEIVGRLPSGVKVRQPSETLSFNVWAFEFTIENHESFGFPIYWRLETDSDPRTDCGWYGVSRTEGELSVSGGGSITQAYRYWFETPGNYTWRYVAEYPSGNPVASWQGTLTVAP